LGARKKAAVPPTKTRTSIWLANDLRAKLDRRCAVDNSSLARTIDQLLREALGRQPKKANADASIFG